MLRRPPPQPVKGGRGYAWTHRRRRSDRREVQLVKLFANNRVGALALSVLAVAAAGCATTGTTGEGGGGGLGSFGILIYLALFGAIIYFLMIRPQRRRTRQQREMTANLAIGDEVRTIGGLFGIVVGISDDHVELGLVEGRIRVSRGAIAGKIGGGGGSSDPGNEIMNKDGN